MKRIPLIAVFGIFLVSLSFGQTRPRVFDNFDTSEGVRIVTPTVKKVPPVKGKNGKRSRRRYAGMPFYVKKISMSSSRSMRGFTTGDKKVDSYILASSRKHKIDPLLVYAQMHQESAFRKRARSYKGASGLMQLMPATARRFGVRNIYDPKQNIEGGVKYMRWLINKFNGDVVLALAGYNAGEGAVMKYGWTIPPYRETREYVRRIANRYNSIKDGSLLKNAKKVSAEEAGRLADEEAVPLALYEPNVMAVQLPNGRTRLVSQ